MCSTIAARLALLSSPREDGPRAKVEATFLLLQSVRLGLLAFDDRTGSILVFVRDTVALHDALCFLLTCTNACTNQSTLVYVCAMVVGSRWW